MFHQVPLNPSSSVGIIHLYKAQESYNISSYIHKYLYRCRLRALDGRAEHRGSLRQLAFDQHFSVRVVLDPRGPEVTNKRNVNAH